LIPNLPLIKADKALRMLLTVKNRRKSEASQKRKKIQIKADPVVLQTMGRSKPKRAKAGKENRFSPNL
jgi:hypothetical protein